MTPYRNSILKASLIILYLEFGNSQIFKPARSSDFKPIDLLSSYLFGLKDLTGSPSCTIFLATHNLDRQTRPFVIASLEYFESETALTDKVILSFDQKGFASRRNHQLDYAFHFSRACSLVLHFDYDNRGIPDQFRKIIPGGIFQSYHLFLQISNPVFETGELSISAGLEILHFAVYNLGELFPDSDTVSQIFTSNNQPNWDRRAITIALETHSGYSQIQHFKKYDQWNQYLVATLYYMSQDLNATLAFNPIMGIPSQGRLKSGSWGDFVQPLLNGSNQVCTQILPSFYPSDLMYFSKPTLYSDYIFITALPTVRSLTPFETLIIPFNDNMWEGILLSMIGMFIMLQGSIISSLKQTGHPFSFALYQRRSAEALLAVFNLILDQPGLGQGLLRLFKRGEAWRFFIIWSMGAMILNNLYKCNVISAVVKPIFSFAPRNFDELMNSNFKVNGILFDENFDKDLQVANNSLAQFLLNRTKDTGWPHGLPVCLLGILKWNSVCLGLRVQLDTTGRMFLTSPERQPLYRESDDGIMPIAASFGVSRHYPDVLCSLNKIIKLLEPSGLYGVWINENRRGNVQIGRQMSPKNAQFDDSASGRTVWFLFQISLGGYVTSMVIFIFEIVYTSVSKYRQKNLVIVVD